MKKIINIKNYSKNIAVYDGYNRAYTYKTIFENSDKLKMVLGDRCVILVLCDRNLETISFVLELMLQGYVPLLMPNDINLIVLNKLIEAYKPSYVYLSNVDEFGKENRYEKIMLKLENHYVLKLFGYNYKLNEELALLLTTSGTTGSRKLVRISYNNLHYSCLYSCKKHMIREEHRGILSLPINHILGFIFCLWQWYVGATVVITQDLIYSDKFEKVFIENKINNFVGVPWQFSVLNKLDFWNEEKVKNLNFAMVAGSRIIKEDVDNLINRLNNKILIAYGMTEVTGEIASIPLKDCPEIEVVGCVMNEDFIEIDNKSSEIIVSNNRVCLGYANSFQDLDLGNVNKGKINTGDIGYIDERGNLYIKGRISRYIKILGKRISLDEIECLINKTLNENIVCIEKNDELCICCDSTLDEEVYKKIKDFVTWDLKINKQFFNLVRVDNIPLTESGKVNYCKMKSAIERLS